MEDKVILVDQDDEAIGEMDKLQAHKEGRLHRAFSVFVFNSAGELLLQKRADTKYHSGGLWTNTCCSHPRPGEDLTAAAKRRLKEEVGLECEVAWAFSFIYKVEFSNGLFEHELDHVLLGTCNNLPVLNPEEVSEFKYSSLQEIKKDIKLNSDLYTEWLKISIDKIQDYISNEKQK
jgi:isopentenyl-diphosphate delta-isomerase